MAARETITLNRLTANPNPNDSAATQNMNVPLKEGSAKDGVKDGFKGDLTDSRPKLIRFGRLRIYLDSAVNLLVHKIRNLANKGKRNDLI